MDNLEIAKEAVYLYFDGFSARESIVKSNEMYLGVDQNNQGTKKNIQVNYSIFQEDLKCR